MRQARTAIKVEFEISVPSAPLDIDAMKKLMIDTCRQEGVRNAAISIRIVDDAGMIEMHRQYLGKSGTTDVLSFDLSDAFEDRQNFVLIVNAQLAARQAKRRGHTAQAELALYITHGLLHNLGYDDADKEQARRMHRAEDAVLDRHGFGPVYFRSKQIKGD